MVYWSRLTFCLYSLFIDEYSENNTTFRKLECFRREVKGRGDTNSVDSDNKSYSLSLSINVTELDVTSIEAGTFSDQIVCASPECCSHWSLLGEFISYYDNRRLFD
jgi:hypothetical protein